MRKKVETFIKEHKMIEPEDKVIVAVSGGADSVCLLHLLAEMRASLNMRLRVVHVHHGLRGAEADRDAAFVENMAEKMGIFCQVLRRNVAEYADLHGMSVEEAGRAVRYQILEDEAAKWGNAKIAVAHHREDQAETILHHLFRGSGIKGMSGMAAVRGAVIRPLLCVGRKEILEYLEEKGIGHCEDSTNDLSDYTRNRLRRHLIPQICGEINAGAVLHIVRTGELLSQADEYFEEKADEIWRGEGKETERGCGIAIKVLNSYPEMLRRYLIRKMMNLCTGTMKDIGFSNIDHVSKIIQKGTGKSVSLPYGLEAKTDYDMLWIVKAETESFRIQKINDIKSFTFRHFPCKKPEEIPENRYTKWFDYDKIKGMLSVRTRQTGDYITLKDGKRKTVKAYMIDEKIPRQERDHILLIAEEHHILWIVGYRISEYYKITEDTRQILQVQADGGEGNGGQDSDSDSRRPGE